MRDQIERFGFTLSSFDQDYMSCAFDGEVRIGDAYRTAFAGRRGSTHPVEQKLTLTASRKTIKPGDTMTLVHAPWPTRNLGVARAVEKVRSVDIAIGGSHLGYPRATGFAYDGRMVRIAMGSERDPDATRSTNGSAKRPDESGAYASAVLPLQNEGIMVARLNELV